MARKMVLAEVGGLFFTVLTLQILGGLAAAAGPAGGGGGGVSAAGGGTIVTSAAGSASVPLNTGVGGTLYYPSGIRYWNGYPAAQSTPPTTIGTNAAIAGQPGVGAQTIYYPSGIFYPNGVFPGQGYLAGQTSGNTGTSFNYSVRSYGGQWWYLSPQNGLQFNNGNGGMFNYNGGVFNNNAGGQ